MRHSSLDRRCKNYRSVKREAANLAVESITKSKNNSKIKYLKDENFNSTQHSQAKSNTYSDTIKHNSTILTTANKNELTLLHKDLNCLKNENNGFQKQNEENKQRFEEGMEMLGRAIERTNNIAAKFDDNLKSLTITIVQISRN